MNIENYISRAVDAAVAELWPEAAGAPMPVQKTRKEFAGDYTLVVFPLLKASRKSPEATAAELGEKLMGRLPEAKSYNVVKGFLNISLGEEFWSARFDEMSADADFGTGSPTGKTVMVEYSSPNTNKPLHLGHIRNNLLGYSVAAILRAAGNDVIKANLVNDRGIHICKSMLAWQLFGGGETPESSGMKGDHLVGKYYVEFDKHYKAEVRELMAAGQSEEDAKRNAPMILRAQDMLRRWEARDPEVHGLWERMNGWVYDGFDVTYRSLGIEFDKIYYESQTYLLGKELVEKGLSDGVLYRREDGSVWIDLTQEGLDEKLLLRGDGTSVYITQDLGTAYRRFADNNLAEIVYVVGNEQNYHFQVLKLALAKLGYKEWSDNIFHLSYGMVELPEGKMKSREGTVVDADDLIAAMVATARDMSQELGKLDGVSDEQAQAISHTVGMGALKYFILKVDPKKTMLFDPRESIDFNGNTGPFIQYTHARIRSILRKAADAGIAYATAAAPDASRYLAGEVELIKAMADFPGVVGQAAAALSPSVVASYAYDLAKMFNGYYHDHSILHESDPVVRDMRLRLAGQVASVIKRAMKLLGIDVPERM